MIGWNWDRVFRSRIWLIVLLTAVSVVTTLTVAQYRFKPVYEAKAMLMLVNKKTPVSLGEQQLTWDALTTNIRLGATYRDILTSPAILGEAVKKYPEWAIDANELSRRVKVESLEGLPFLSLSLQDDSYEKAAGIVNGIARLFTVRIYDLMKIDNVEVLYLAQPLAEPTPVSPSLEIRLIVSCLASIVVGTAATIAIRMLDRSIRSAKQTERELHLPVLAATAVISKRDLRKVTFPRGSRLRQFAK